MSSLILKIFSQYFSMWVSMAETGRDMLQILHITSSVYWLLLFLFFSFSLVNFYIYNVNKINFLMLKYLGTIGIFLLVGQVFFCKRLVVIYLWFYYRFNHLLLENLIMFMLCWYDWRLIAYKVCFLVCWGFGEFYEILIFRLFFFCQ